MGGSYPYDPPKQYAGVERIASNQNEFAIIVDEGRIFTHEEGQGTAVIPLSLPSPRWPQIGSNPTMKKLICNVLVYHGISMCIKVLGALIIHFY